MLDLSTYNDPWVKVPLEFADVKISSLTIDGAPVALHEGAIFVEKPGAIAWRWALKSPG